MTSYGDGRILGPGEGKPIEGPTALPMVVKPGESAQRGTAAGRR